MWIVLDLVVGFVECAGKPLIVVASDLMILVRHPIIPQDLCPGWVGRNNELLARRKPSSLIEVYGFLDIRGHRVIILVPFLDAVDLNGQRDRDFSSFEFSSKC